MKLQQKPQTIEAVLWTGATFSEWPSWIRSALIAKKEEYPKLTIANDSDVCIINSSSNLQTFATPGTYLVFGGDGIFTDSFENLSKYYNRLNTAGRPVELLEMDTLSISGDPGRYTEDDDDELGQIHRG